MSNIAERLRELADLFEQGDAPRHVVLHMRAGADEIERLRAATDLVRAETLEEAARVADELSDRWTKEWRAGLKADSRLEALSDGADDVAFAIRVKKGKPTDPSGSPGAV
jgi:predicted phage gp36 major capsid-like protein